MTHFDNMNGLGIKRKKPDDKLKT